MRPNIDQHVQGVVESTKVVGTVSTVTTAAGLGTVLNYLPDVLGSVATMAGIMLSWFLICKVRTETKKIKLEMALLREREQKRHDEVEHRVEEGEPCRRESDTTEG